jgi:hypothetical protein
MTDILISPLVSIDHCIISHSSIASSNFPFGILWPLNYQPKGKLEDVIKEWLITQWPKDNKGEIRRRNRRMTNNSMVKRYQRGN